MIHISGPVTEVTALDLGDRTYVSGEFEAVCWIRSSINRIDFTHVFPNYHTSWNMLQGADAVAAAGVSGYLDERIERCGLHAAITFPWGTANVAWPINGPANGGILGESPPPRPCIRWWGGIEDVSIVDVLVDVQLIAALVSRSLGITFQC